MEFNLQKDYKINKNFQLKYFGEVPYLVPFGQAGADMLRAVRLNPTGVFLWNMQVLGVSKEKIIKGLLELYGEGEDKIPQLEADIDDFYNKMLRYRIIVPDGEAAIPFKDEISKKFTIAGFNLKYKGPEKMFAKEFEPFCEEFSDYKTCFEFIVRLGTPAPLLSGELLIKKEEFSLVETKEQYICLFPKGSFLQEWRMEKNCKSAYIYCMCPDWGTAADELFHAMRMIFLVLAQEKGYFAVHSASLLYRERAWLFCGHSGAGKSTHVNLWAEQFQVELLNGDLNLIKITDSECIVHGIPWCGTSGISTSKCYKLGGIIFLKQHECDKVRLLQKEEREFCLWLRLISPAWTKEMLQENVSFVKSIPESLPMFQLMCTKEPSAAYEIKSAIDSFL